MMRLLTRVTTGTLAAVGILLVAIQFAPYGRVHTNPPVRREPPWDTPATREVARQACFDCHSNETAWPWYTSVAPVSWLAQRDVDEGREALNFSEWDRAQEEAGEAAKTIRDGTMPPRLYTVIHPAARLSAVEADALIRGLEETLGSNGRDAEATREREEAAGNGPGRPPGPVS